MRVHRIVTRILLAGTLAATAACVTGFAVAVAPPAMRIEARGIAPAPAYVWVPGHWVWRSEWSWVAGRWELPPRGMRAWVPGRWERHHRGWVWVEGRWRR